MEGNYDERKPKPQERHGSYADGIAKLDAVIDEAECREHAAGEAGGGENLVVLPGLRKGTG
jgi:hypothetical protein